MDISKVNNPLLIFNINNPKSEYYRLVHDYHPDHNPGSDGLEMAHINKLWGQYQDIIKVHKVEPYVFYTKRESYYTTHISPTHIKFKFDIPVGIENFIVPSWKYAGDKMEKEFSRIMPNITYDFVENSCSVTTPKDSIPLDELLIQFPTGLPHKHVAWIISRMLNIASYLSYMGIQYGGFISKNLWVNVEDHTIYPLGGWWCSGEIGTPFKLLDKEIVNKYSSSQMSNPGSNFDVKLIKDLGLALLGNKMISELKTLIPAEFLDWLISDSNNSAIKEYLTWDKVLIQSYGKREFIVLPYDRTLIYTTSTI